MIQIAGLVALGIAAAAGLRALGRPEPARAIGLIVLGVLAFFVLLVIFGTLFND